MSCASLSPIFGRPCEGEPGHYPETDHHWFAGDGSWTGQTWSDPFTVSIEDFVPVTLSGGFDEEEP